LGVDVAETPLTWHRDIQGAARGVVLMETSVAAVRKLPVREAAAFLGLSKSYLDKKRLDGGGPPYLKLGRRVLYDVADLEVWAANHKRLHTSESP
jgi:predicted DNA-binding transcriptional regulator AlpA